MRRIVAAIIGMAALSAADAPAAFAGDVTPSAPVAASPCVHCYFPDRWTANWTAFYIGGDLGGAWINNAATWNPLPSPLAFGVFPISASNNGSALIGGFHAGYNYQFTPTWVAGLEGDWSWTRAHGSFTQAMSQDPPPVILPGSFTTMSTTLDWLSSLRGRFGYLVAPTLMAYATGGLAWAKFDYAASNSNGGTGALAAALYNAPVSFSNTQIGFTVGGGLEWMMAQNWLLRAEYLYYGFNHGPNVIGTSANWPAFPSNYVWSATNISVVQAGLSYKF